MVSGILAVVLALLRLLHSFLRWVLWLPSLSLAVSWVLLPLSLNLVPPPKISAWTKFRRNAGNPLSSFLFVRRVCEIWMQSKSHKLFLQTKNLTKLHFLSYNVHMVERFGLDEEQNKDPASG